MINKIELKEINNDINKNLKKIYFFLIYRYMFFHSAYYIFLLS